MDVHSFLVIERKQDIFGLETQESVTQYLDSEFM